MTTPLPPADPAAIEPPPRPPRPPRPPSPGPVSYRLIEADFDRDIPPEYHGATLVPSLEAVLRTHPVTVLVMGPPGAGKTRQGWAMVRTERRQRCARFLDPGEIIHPVWTGRAWVPQRPRRSWARSVLGPDRVLLISESSDLRRCHFDYEWLDGPTRHPSWLIVDDIAHHPPTAWVTEAIYHLANERRAWRRPTLWTTNATPAGLQAQLGAAIASRLMGGAVVHLGGTDHRLGHA